MKSEFYEEAKPARVYMSNYEFVESIDYGQMDKDRQTQIDAAYRYIGGTEFTDRSRSGHRRFNYELMIFIIILGAIGTFVLDYFNIVDLKIF